MNFEIGTFHEKDSREIVAHTSYAADYINHQTRKGNYPATLITEGGYTIPMPSWLCVSLETEITGGNYYSGFGGVNYNATPAKKGPSKYVLQMYSYEIPNLIKAGKLTLKPEWDFLNADIRDVIDHIKENGLPG